MGADPAWSDPPCPALAKGGRGGRTGPRGTSSTEQGNHKRDAIGDGPEGRRSGEGLFGDVVVGVDVLDVLVLLEEVAELEHPLAVVDVEVDVGAGHVAGLGGLGGDPVRLD